MKKITKYAKENRKKPTKAEKELRKILLGKFKFRTQRMYDFFIADFLIIDKKLLIELDGCSHIGKEKYDRRRDKYLTKKGFTIKHFKNEVVFNNPDKILNYIKSLPDIPQPPLNRFSELYGRSAY